MRKKGRNRVLGVHAPRPRPTAWAAFAVATGLSLVFLVCLGLWRLLAALLG